MSTVQDLTYHAPAWRAFTCGRGAVLVQTAEAVVEMRSKIADVLRLCRGARTLEEHEQCVVTAGVFGAGGDIRGVLRALVEAGLLVPTSDWRRAEVRPHVWPPRRDITTVAFPTADRSQYLLRCLKSVVEHCGLWGSKPRLLVVDGSRNPEHAAQTRAALSLIAKANGHRFEYVGQNEARALQVGLAGAAGNFTSRTLCAGTVGANRNLITLLTAGEHVLMVDDDVILKPWTLADAVDAVSLMGHGDFSELSFYPSRHSALSSVNYVNADLLGAHSRLLGQQLTTIVATGAGPPSLTHACQHLIASEGAGDAWTVRVTFSGIAGDSGAACPEKLLVSSDHVTQALLKSELTYRTAMESREVVRGTRSHVVAHEGVCMGYCTGFANAAVLPPFVHVGRNEDGMFGAMMTATDPQALVGHVPIGVVHDSPRRSRFTRPRMPSARFVSLAELIICLVKACGCSTVASQPSVRLERLASFLMDTGRLCRSDFADLVRSLVLDLRAHELTRIEHLLSLHPEYPDYWRRDLEEYSRTMRHCMMTSDYCRPIGFEVQELSDDPWASAQQVVLEFGQLTAIWPALWHCKAAGSGAVAV